MYVVFWRGRRRYESTNWGKNLFELSAEMGNLCESCCGKSDDNESQDGDGTSRTHLLGNNAQNVPSPGGRNQSDDAGRYRGSLPRHNDEQSALNQLLQKTATNIIDVAALEVQTLQQQDVLERSRQYSQRLQATGNKVVLPDKQKKVNMLDVPSAEDLLSKTPVTEEDSQLMKQWTESIADAVQNIKVESRGDLIATLES